MTFGFTGAHAYDAAGRAPSRSDLMGGSRWHFATWQLMTAIAALGVAFGVVASWNRLSAPEQALRVIGGMGHYCGERRFGPDLPVVQVALDEHVTDAHLARVQPALAVLRSVRMLAICSPSISDAGLADLDLGVLPELQRLDLSDTGVTDGGLKHLRLSQLAKLRELDLDGTAVTDAGVCRLASEGLPGLEVLHLSRTKVTDAGLIHLMKMTSLREIDLDDTIVTDAGRSHLGNLPRLESLHVQRTKATKSMISILRNRMKILY